MEAAQSRFAVRSVNSKERGQLITPRPLQPFKAKVLDSRLMVIKLAAMPAEAMAAVTSMAHFTLPWCPFFSKFVA